MAAQPAVQPPQSDQLAPGCSESGSQVKPKLAAGKKKGEEGSTKVPCRILLLSCNPGPCVPTQESTCSLYSSLSGPQGQV